MARIWLALLLAGGVLLFAGAPLPITDGDVPVYGTAARGLLASGDWVTLRHPGFVFDKPPLTIWFMALSLRLVGDSPAGLRLWQLLLALVLLVGTYRLARRAAPQAEAVLAVLLLLTAVQVFYQILIPQQDIALTTFLTLAFLAYLTFRDDPRASAAVGAGLAVAGGVLSKGLVAAGLFALVVGADLLVARRRGERPPGYGAWAGLGAFLLVATPWYVAGALREGWGFLTLHLGETGITRYLRPYLTQTVPVHGYLLQVPTYIPLLLLGLLPWTGVLPGAIREAYRSLRSGPPSLRLCALWAGLVFLAFSLSAGDKVMRYLLPCFPPLAILGARFLGEVFDRPRKLRPGALLSLAVGVPGVLAVAWYLRGAFPEEQRVFLPLLVPFLSIFLAAIGAFVVVVFWGWARAAVTVLAAGTLLAYTALECQMARRYESLFPWRTVAATIRRAYAPGDRVVVVGLDPGGHFVNYHLEAWSAREVTEADLPSLWHGGPLFAVLTSGAHARLRPALRPRVLLQTPALVLVTNGEYP